jgi:hypothetical protein
VPYKWKAFHANGGPQQESKPGAEHSGWLRKPDPENSTETRPAIGGPITVQTYPETEIQKAVAWFTSYLMSERESYYSDGHPLPVQWRKSMDGFFEAAMLDRVKVVELTDRRVANPWFYPAAREKGVRHLPDITHKAAVTFLDVVVFNGKIASRDLFHGLVHAAQVKVLGIAEFTELFVRGFLRARSYFLVPLKAHAFALDARFASNPLERFSVEKEIGAWRLDGRY